MPRQARVVAVGVRHHVTQRGNNRQDIFLLDDDRRFYVETLGRWSQRCGLTLLGYCLMTNHVHLVAVPQRPDSLAQALGNTHQLHAQRFNRRYGRSGHAWQNRFFSCPLGPDRTAVALAYCDLNPVRTGLVGRAENWPWSSARAHLEQRDDSGLLDMKACRRACDLQQWRGVLETGGSHGGRDGIAQSDVDGTSLRRRVVRGADGTREQTDGPNCGGIRLKKKLKKKLSHLALSRWVTVSSHLSWLSRFYRGFTELRFAPPGVNDYAALRAEEGSVPLRGPEPRGTYA